MDNETTIHQVKTIVKKFCEDRDWDQFHSAKELAIGISTEAAELLQLFRFKSEEQIIAMFKDPVKGQKIRDEMADTFYFVLRLAQKYDVDLVSALNQKIESNAKKYPVDLVKGQNKKYDEYQK